MMAPRSCDDGFDCTHDVCSRDRLRCDHVPDDALCPNTQLCSPKRGCDAFVYGVASDGHLYEVRVPSGGLVDLGPSAAALGDIALDSQGVLYATDSYVLYRVDRETSEATSVASILPLHLYNGLGTTNGRSLLATADVPQLFEIGTANGLSIPVAPLPSGYRASGDVTAAGSHVFVSATLSACPATDSLVRMDPAAHSSSIVGEVGYCCVWGLATLGGRVYGLTCEGRILAIDTTTGSASETARAALAFFGAAGR
ncbi:MAG: hypothetical protein M3O46_08775 [Myxococcota bacterium]|nr:hypothetical protein [Myxococcota bacterium]